MRRSLPGAIPGRPPSPAALLAPLVPLVLLAALLATAAPARAGGRIAVLPFRSVPAAPGMAPLERGFHRYVALLVGATAGWEGVPAETLAAAAEAWGPADGPPDAGATALLAGAGAGAALSGTFQSQAGSLRLRAELYAPLADGVEPLHIALNGRAGGAAALAADLATIVAEALELRFPRVLRPPLGGAPDFRPDLLEPSFGAPEPPESLKQTETFMLAALRLDPNNADAYAQLGALYGRNARPEKAFENLGTAVELAPKNPRYHLWLGTAYFRQGQLEEALTEFLQSTVIDETFTDGFVALAALERRLGDAKAARETLERAARARPGDPRALTALGADLLLEGERDAARDLFGRARGADPRFAPASVNLGLLAWEAGDLDDARRELERALAADPTNPAALLGLGVVVGARGLPEEAAERFRSALDAGAPRAVALHNLGIAELEAGRLDDARATLRRAVDLAPEYAAPRAGLGVLELLSGEFDEAAATFRGSRDDSPAGAALAYDLALLEQLRGNQQQALVGYLRALQARRDLLPAHVNLGILFEAMGRPEKALTEYLKALSGDAPPAEVYTYLGLIYAQRGYGSMAEETIRKTTLVDPASPLAWHTLATSAEAGDPRAAATAWRQFLEGVRRDRNRAFWVAFAERRLAALDAAP